MVNHAECIMWHGWPWFSVTWCAIQYSTGVHRGLNGCSIGRLFACYAALACIYSVSMTDWRSTDGQFGRPTVSSVSIRFRRRRRPVTRRDANGPSVSTMQYCRWPIMVSASYRRQPNRMRTDQSTLIPRALYTMTAKNAAGLFAATSDVMAARPLSFKSAKILQIYWTK